MTNIYRCLALAAIIAATIGPTASQGPPPGGGPPPPPRHDKSFEAWRKWNEKNPAVSAVSRVIAGIDRADRSSKARLTRSQAKKVLAVLTQWRHRKTMSNAQAAKVKAQLLGALNSAQVKSVVAATDRRGGPGGPPPGGPGGPPPPVGPPPGGPGRPAMPKPRSYNPLNPDTLPFAPERPRAKAMIDGLIKRLKAVAASGAG